MFLYYRANFKIVNRFFQVVSFTMVSPLKPSVHFPSNPHIPHSLHIPFFVISSSKSLVSINQEATHYTIPLTYSQTTTTLMCHAVCGRWNEYVHIAC
jgi:hypothetical protein